MTKASQRRWMCRSLVRPVATHTSGTSRIPGNADCRYAVRDHWRAQVCCIRSRSRSTLSLSHPGSASTLEESGSRKLFHQSLNEANWLVATSIAYDCVYDFLKTAERARIEKNVLRPMADWLSVTQAKESDRIHNHGTWAWPPSECSAT